MRVTKSWAETLLVKLRLAPMLENQWSEVEMLELTVSSHVRNAAKNFADDVRDNFSLVLSSKPATSGVSMVKADPCVLQASYPFPPWQNRRYLYLL